MDLSDTETTARICGPFLLKPVWKFSNASGGEAMTINQELAEAFYLPCLPCACHQDTERGQSDYGGAQTWNAGLTGKLRALRQPMFPWMYLPM